MLTQDELRQALHYSPETGEFTRHFKNGKVKRVGSKDKGGYLLISINGFVSYAHRLAWVYMNGDIPDGDRSYKQ